VTLNRRTRKALCIQHAAVPLLVFYIFLIHTNPKGPRLPFKTLVLTYNENLLRYWAGLCYMQCGYFPPNVSVLRPSCPFENSGDRNLAKHIWNLWLPGIETIVSCVTFIFVLYLATLSVTKTVVVVAQILSDRALPCFSFSKYLSRKSYTEDNYVLGKCLWYPASNYGQR
jgi:hypothetical protein